MRPLQALIFVLLQQHCSVDDVVTILAAAQCLLPPAGVEGLNSHLKGLADQLAQQLDAQAPCEREHCTTEFDDPRLAWVLTGPPGVSVGLRQQVLCAPCRDRLKNEMQLCTSENTVEGQPSLELRRWAGWEVATQ